MCEQMANQMIDPINRFSASMQWPGSHVHYRNQTIKYLQDFDDKMEWTARVDKIIEWMSDATEPANCVFAYFDEPDTTAHEFGPFSDEVFAMVSKADNTTKYLLQRLTEESLLSHTNLIVLSDHGMAEVRYGNTL
jgi:predicted AlkP superfamily pyrophosphatase or phosphodiesterase